MAIARDSTGNIALSASPHTINNVAGTYLVVSLGGGSAYASAVTYNGVSMTKTGHGDFKTAGGYYGNMWYLASPATGSNSLAITGSGSFATQWVTYTDVGGIDATSAVASGSGTSVSTSTTVVATGCWLVTATRFESNATGGGTNNTQLQSSGNHFLGDSNGTVSTGAQTATTAGNSSAYVSATISLSPPATSSIKTVNGLAKASVKTVNGLAIASVKTWEGLA